MASSSIIHLLEIRNCYGANRQTGPATPRKETEEQEWLLFTNEYLWICRFTTSIQMTVRNEPWAKVKQEKGRERKKERRRKKAAGQQVMTVVFLI